MQKKRHFKDIKCPARYIKHKVKIIHEKLVKKEPKKTDNEVYNEEKLKRKLTDD